MGSEQRLVTEHSRSADCAVCDRQAGLDMRGYEGDLHRGHHWHLEGTGVWCSCGEFCGITTVAFDKDYDPAKLRCSECGQVGVVRLGDDS